ncbi:MAG TPA: GDSL-type esterase/lipase family protein, partial [Haloplasmataceae bacterium]
EGLLKRLEESVFQLKPKTIFLLIGTNDLALLDTTPKRIAGNIREICREIVDRLPQSTLVLESIYPTISPVFSEITPEAMKARANNVIDYTNGLLQQVAAELGIVYLDINRHLKDETGQLQPDYTRDGLHLTPKGYTIVQQCIKPFIEG